jgi:peptide/nickel transport system ATP-binding protein
MGLLPSDTQISGSIIFDNQELVGASQSSLKKVRQSDLAFIPQDPLANLSPIFKVRKQAQLARSAFKSVHKSVTEISSVPANNESELISSSDSRRNSSSDSCRNSSDSCTISSNSGTSMGETGTNSNNSYNCSNISNTNSSDSDTYFGDSFTDEDNGFINSSVSVCEPGVDLQAGHSESALLEFEQRYPYQLSGGQRQNVLIELATLKRPKLVIADEITSALDQANAQKVLSRLTDSAVLLITHDIKIALKFAIRIGVLRKGELVEVFRADRLDQVQNSYTKDLLDSAGVGRGSVDSKSGGRKSDAGSGSIGSADADSRSVDSGSVGSGAADNRSVGNYDVDSGSVGGAGADSKSTDIEYADISGAGKGSAGGAGADSRTADGRAAGSESVGTVVKVDNLTKSFGGKRLFEKLSFEVERGETVAIFGETGSGKSTVANLILGLIKADQGRVSFTNSELRISQLVQIVFQNPAGTFDPYFTVAQSLEEPMIIHRKFNLDFKSKTFRQGRIRELLKLVNLDDSYLGKKIRQLSGGEVQRVAIARVLTLNPELLILDEALVGLDSITQSHIVDLLLNLQKTTGLAYLFISHDLELVRKFSDRIVYLSDFSVAAKADA